VKIDIDVVVKHAKAGVQTHIRERHVIRQMSALGSTVPWCRRRSRAGHQYRRKAESDCGSAHCLPLRHLLLSSTRPVPGRQKKSSRRLQGHVGRYICLPRLSMTAMKHRDPSRG
jgi:hypothetical protein